jgi:hypothetical protein
MAAPILQPVISRPGSQLAAEDHLARQAHHTGRIVKVSQREHGTVVPDGARPDKPAEWDVVAHWLPKGGGMPLGDGQDHVEAEVVHGRWVTRCPHCPSASRVSMADPRVFCVYCGNGQSIRWHGVLFPPEWRQIEDVLSLRPDPVNRNWSPDETVEDLIEENVRHGLPGGRVPLVMQ